MTAAGPGGVAPAARVGLADDLLREEARARIARLCETYAYPPFLREAIGATVSALLEVRPAAILLVGSAARGEMTFGTRDDGSLELFSDLELICVGDDFDPAGTRAVRGRLDGIESGIARDHPLFHIDVAFRAAGQPGPEARGLGWYEAAATAVVLAGPEVHHLGDPRPERLSLGLLNQLCVIRLWWLLNQLPTTVLLERSAAPLGERRRRELLYSQIRNLLDVASIWLPNAGRFECGYRGRLAVVTSEPSLRGLGTLPAHFPDLLREATRRKLESDLEGDPISWYRDVVASYTGLVAYLVGFDGSRVEDLLPQVREQWTARHPVPVSKRFRAFSGGLALRAAARDPLRAIRRGWDPNGAALVFLLCMHHGALARLDGDLSRSNRFLDLAEEALLDFGGTPPRDDSARGEPAERWRRLRLALLPPFGRYFRKVRGHLSTVSKDLVRDQAESE